MNRQENPISRANWTMLACTVLFIVMSLFSQLLYRGEDLLHYYSISALLCSIGALYVPALLFLRRRSLIAYGEVRLNPGQVLLCVSMGFSLFLLSSAINALALYLAQLFHIPNSPVRLPDMQGWRVLGALIVIALIPAVTEERLFRSLLLNAYRPLGRRGAILLSSLLFALMHGQVVSLPAIFFMACVMGSLSYDSGSRYPSFIIHLTNNTLAVLLTALADSEAASAEALTAGAALLSAAFYAILGIPIFLLSYSRLKTSFRGERVFFGPDGAPVIILQGFRPEEKSPTPPHPGRRGYPLRFRCWCSLRSTYCRCYDD